MGKSDFNDYEGFVEKFKPKKTTDDCYTPDWVYDFVKDWVDANVCKLAGHRIVRPFFPGGDYEHYEYKTGDIVLDNPPFSILAKIRRFYTVHGIKYFLFAPALTLAAAKVNNFETFICAHLDVVYNNGAVVRTSFVTNLIREGGIWAAGTMYKAFEAQKKKEAQKTSKTLKKLSYPDTVITPANLGRLVVRGIELRIPDKEVLKISALDCQRVNGRGIFGGGWLVSERAAAERAAAERAAAERLTLSARELKIIANLGKNDHEI